MILRAINSPRAVPTVRKTEAMTTVILGSGESIAVLMLMHEAIMIFLKTTTADAPTDA